MRKTIALLLLFAVILSAHLTVFSSSHETRLDISITKGGSSVEQAKIGEIVKATVSMTDFPFLSMITPSLHFNPQVVQVVHPLTKEILLETPPGDSSFFETGSAIDGTPSPNNWGGIVSPLLPSHPFLDNESGVIGMLMESKLPAITAPSVADTQTLYSVYFEVIGAGNADIRLVSMDDKNYDEIAFARGEPRFARYNFTIDYAVPENSTFDTHVNFTPPVFYVPLQDSIAEIFKANTQKITDASQLQGGDTIYAAFDSGKLKIPTKLIFSVYDGEKMIAFDVSNGNKSRNITLPENIQNCTIKVLIWGDLSEMTPVFKPLNLGGKSQ